MLHNVYFQSSLSLPFGCSYFKVHLVWDVASQPYDPYTGTHARVTVYFSVQTPLATQWIGDLPIIPRHIWDQVSDPSSYNPLTNRTLVGTGPFKYNYDESWGPEEIVRLTANPLYLRKFIWPDVGDINDPLNPYAKDGKITLYDFMIVCLPQHIFAREDDNGQWSTPPGDWGEPCDVNKDGKIGMSDLMEIGVHFAKRWPPSWYADPPQSGTQSSIDSLDQADSAEQESLLGETAAPNNAYSEAFASSSDPQLSVHPAIITAKPGKNFTVDITVSDVTDLYGWEFWLEFDPSILQVTSHIELEADVADRIGNGTQTTFQTDEWPVVPFNPDPPFYEGVYVNYTLMSQPDDYTIDYPTGTITFTTAPGVGAEIAVVYRFYAPVYHVTNGGFLEETG